MIRKPNVKGTEIPIIKEDDADFLSLTNIVYDTN